MTKANDLPANPYPSPTYDGPANMLSDEAQLRLQGRQALSPPHGPVFILAASDPLAPMLVKRWVELSRHNKDVTPMDREEARRIALAMELWQKDRGIAP